MSRDENRESFAGEIAAKIKFLTTAEIALKNGNVLNMSDLHAAYDSILKENGIADRHRKHEMLPYSYRKMYNYV